MSKLTIHYHGQRVGTLAEAKAGLVFEYDPAFLESGHELSPFNLPLLTGVHVRSGGQLPGLFDDSLPDAWGRRVMLDWFRRQGALEHQVTPLAMLTYVGRHGMGALTYEPAREESEVPGQSVSLEALQEAAVQAEQASGIDLNLFAEIGSSAGGARPKALIALPRSGSGPVLAGAGEIPPSHEAWLIKFDTSPDGTAGPMEEAYARMARAAGVEMPPTRLIETRHGPKVRRHFAIKRFDRDGDLRIHHHTLAAMLHVGAGDLSYEVFLRATRRLTRDEDEVWRAFRRAAFNVLASNRDDHGKNHGFVYRERQWTLGPAYDLTFTSPKQLRERGMAILGERVSADATTLRRLAAAEALDRRAAEDIIEQVRSAVNRWREFADQAQVPAIPASAVDQVLHSIST